MEKTKDVLHFESRGAALTYQLLDLIDIPIEKRPAVVQLLDTKLNSLVKQTVEEHREYFTNRLNELLETL